MKKLSKFDFGSFYGWDERYFVVSRQRYSREEAIALFERECDADDETAYEISEASVVWRAGINENGEPQVGWWLDWDHDGTEPRYCPVWQFEY